MRKYRTHGATFDNFLTAFWPVDSSGRQLLLSEEPTLKRTLLLLLVCVFSSAQAQSYIGVGGAWQTSSAYGSAPLVSIQVGGQAAPEFGRLEVRAALDTLLLFSNLSLDAFASVRLHDTLLRVYFGGGPDVLIFAPLDSIPGQERFPVSSGLHGTLGLEFLTGSVRPFAELQPAAALYGEPVVGLKARAGVNVYFQKC